MQLQPVYETVTATLSKTQITEHVKSECKTDVLSETVKKILNVGVFPTIINSTTEDGKIKYTAKTVFYICYVDNEDQIKKCECSNEVQGVMACEGANCRGVLHLGVEKTEADLSGINLKVSALVSVKAVVPNQTEIKAVCGGDELICKTAEAPIKKGYGIKEGLYPLEEQFTIPHQIEEVLYHRAEPVITSVQCGVGCIIIDGEVRLSAILLQKGEKKDIIKMTKNFPFRAEMEYEDSMPSFTAIAKVSLKSFKTDVEVDLDGGKSQITLSAMLVFNSEAFSFENLTFATDLFSLSHDVQTEKQETLLCEVEDVRTCNHKTSCLFPSEENLSETNIRAIAGEKIEILSACVNNGELEFTGTLNAVGYFVNLDQKIYTKKIEIPLEFKCDCVVPNGCYVDAIAVGDCSNTMLTNNGIEFDLDVTITVYPTKQKRFETINDVKCILPKVQNNCAISVYIAQEGEELWSLAKRLNVRPELLIETNPDLNFPLDGSERIVIYRQI
ncbi:MAG: hypothetical protein IKA12_01995 [Clostridia bacterium]|nr:hypothetical protein [Clostridia bacterium]